MCDLSDRSNLTYLFLASRYIAFPAPLKGSSPIFLMSLRSFLAFFALMLIDKLLPPFTLFVE